MISSSDMDSQLEWWFGRDSFCIRFFLVLQLCIHLWLSLQEWVDHTLEPESRAWQLVEDFVMSSEDKRFLGIGNNKYLEHAELAGAIGDMNAVAKVLKQQYGFIMESADLLENATCKQMYQAFERYVEMEPFDTLVLYYAGHGCTDNLCERPYWLPVDAGLDRHEKVRWIDSATIVGAVLAKIQARHILVVSDSCFSGDMLRSRDLVAERPDGWEESALRYKSREILTSGMDTPVADQGLGGHSPFAYHLLGALEDNEESWVDGFCLWDRVRRGVTGQIPQYGVLLHAGHQNGGACILRRVAGRPAKKLEYDLGVDNEDKVTDKHMQSTVPDSIEMVLVDGGTFQMGSNTDENGQPVHMVTVDSFHMGTYEITQDIYEEVVGINPSQIVGEKFPVEFVSWYDAVAFANALSQRDGLEEVYAINGKKVECNWNARGYRLPTEAEWEYAARGGNQSRNYRYAGSNNARDVAWYVKNSGEMAHKVGGKQPNELGLYDMSGNVWEWCWDKFGAYHASAILNPHGPNTGKYRVFRGGGWGEEVEDVRTVVRYGCAPSERTWGIGFRLVLPVGY